MTTPITTTTQLEALSEGSVIAYLAPDRPRDASPGIATRITPDSWAFAGSAEPWLSSDIWEPGARITVLWPLPEPECDHAALVRHLAQSTVLSLASAEAVVHAATNWTTPAPAMKPDREDMVKALYAGRRSTWSTMPEDLKERWRKHADLILDALPGKTESQVRADERAKIATSLRNMRTTDDERPVPAFLNVADWLDRLADKEAGK